MSDRGARDLVLNMLDGALHIYPGVWRRFQTSAEVRAAVLSNVPALVAVIEMMQRSGGYSMTDTAELIGDSWMRLLEQTQDADQYRQHVEGERMRDVQIELPRLRVADLPESLHGMVGQVFPTLGYAVDGSG